MDHEGRIDRVRARLAEAEVDALLVTDLTNVRYLTGFSGTNGQLVVTSGGATFFSDPRYEARAQTLVRGAEIVIYPSRLTDLLPDHLAGANVRRIGFESESVTVAGRDRLSEELSDVELVATSKVVEDLRRIKDRDEIDLIRAAVELGDATFSWMIDRLAPGDTEREIALELEMHVRNEGAEAVAFEPIVGSGELSAHIHHTPSERALQKGDLVLIDFGCKRDGYCSDLTRTVVLGAASEAQRELYDLVLAANRAGIDALRAGAEGRWVDGVARGLIEEAGHGDAFGHGLGHGVGIDVHEAPRLHRNSEDELQAGDVVTVEPGVYLVGSGGVRIEDCVLVTAEGAEVLTTTPKDDLLEL
ncbi:MAG: M24 family metallopeptidase [Actinomycetota bacterium]